MGRKTRAKKVASDSDHEDSDVEISTKDDDAPTLTVKTSPFSSKLFIVPNSLESLGWKTIATVSLPHPRTGNPALFLIDSRVESTSSQFLFEILTFEQPLRSWFVDDNVVSDGDFRCVTQVDPLFLILPIIKKSSKARPLSDHLCDDLPPQVAEVMCRRLTEEQLENIATKKRVDDDLVVYVYSEESALSWLAKKVEKTAEFLSKRNITRSEASISSNFTFSSASIQRDDNEYLRYGCDVIGEYLEDELKNLLLTKLGLPAGPDRKRKTEGVVDEHEGVAKKSKVTGETVKPLEDYGTNSTPTPAKGTANKIKKDLVKAAQGTHSLFKFFTPKAK